MSIQGTPVERTAATLLAVEAVGVAGLVGWQIVAFLGNDVASVSSSLALMVLTAVGAVAVAGFAFGTWRGDSWGRSGGFVTQLLIASVAIGTIGGPAQSVTVGIVLAAVAVIVGIVVILAMRAAALRAAREDESRDAD